MIVIRRGIIVSCQSAATSKIVKDLLVTSLDSCKQRCSKYLTLTFYLCSSGNVFVRFLAFITASVYDKDTLAVLGSC